MIREVDIKVVGGVVTVLVTIVLALIGAAWATHVAAAEARLTSLEAETDATKERLARIEAHYEHIERELERIIQKLESMQ